MKAADEFEPLLHEAYRMLRANFPVDHRTAFRWLLFKQHLRALQLRDGRDACPALCQRIKKIRDSFSAAAWHPYAGRSTHLTPAMLRR